MAHHSDYSPPIPELQINGNKDKVNLHVQPIRNLDKDFSIVQDIGMSPIQRTYSLINILFSILD